MKVDFNIPYGAEKWVLLNYNGNILPRYSISDYGRIYDNQRRIFIDYHYQKGLYFYASIRVNHSKTVNYAVHRAVLISFNPISNFKEMQVNHKDGNVQNNMLCNLEWVTPAENTWHAIHTGLRNQTGINNGRSIFNDNDIHKICKLIDCGYNNSEIANELGYIDKLERNKFMSNIRNIRAGKTRRDISCQYNFMKENKFRLYNANFAYLVCNFLSDVNRDFTYDEIADYLQIPKEERLNFKQYVNKLILGKTATLITQFYDLKRPLDYYEDQENGYKK